ncbi:hypothetical protein [Flavobacterium sp.]|uniref:hypothetical protein n=1 Tax=Flavobacterium sp. TaxID=239 RepID=UPI00286DF5A7|nr:hypothetical protein [Flavobacterium sp.]
MKKLFFISLIFFILTSCGKSKEVKILAKNAATGAPYAGLEYVVVSSRTTANGEKYRTEANGTLNSNGEAMVSIKQKSGRTYSIRVVEPENTCYNKQITRFFDSPFDVNGTFTFEFAECAYLTLSVNNVNCQGATDKIVFDLQPTYIPNYTNIIPTEKLGCYTNTFSESMIPYGNWEAKWEVTRGGITTYHDSLFLLMKMNILISQ